MINNRRDSAVRSVIDETYRLVTGKAGIIRNHCEASVSNWRTPRG